MNTTYVCYTLLQTLLFDKSRQKASASIMLVVCFFFVFFQFKLGQILKTKL